MKFKVEIVLADDDRTNFELAEALQSVLNHSTAKEAIEGGLNLNVIAMQVCLDSRSQENPLWENNSIQFPRLLAEICACQDDLDLNALADSMDLEVEEVCELLYRAQDEWEEIKRKHCPMPQDKT